MARGPKGIPDSVVERVRERLEAHARQNWASCKAVAVRSRGGFVYVDVQGAEDPEPAPICRLKYTGSIDSWEFAYFTWAHEKYQPCFVRTGSPFGSPEDCFDTAAFSVLTSQS